MSARPSHNYFDFTRKERRGVMVLLVMILLLCAIPFIYPLIYSQKAVMPVSFDSSLATLQSQQVMNKRNYEPKYNDEEKRPYDQPSFSHPSNRRPATGALFAFDPNTLSREGWAKLGLRDKTISTILNFRNKGGTFRQAEDIKKIWGLFPDEAERLMPYVSIASTAGGTATRNYSNDFSSTKKFESRKSYQQVDINSADTTAWIALPGIGSKLSQRIIHFREKLGGFYTVAQVAETFGLADSTFQKIKPFLEISGEIKKININNATIEEMKQHPYIRYQLANAIFQYRVQHGPYTTTIELKKIMIMTEDIYNKLLPYLSVE